ncbi:hypothetical protein K458DRAFT_135068 [Lentithecium fluviatile CBS 122367]|uniref:Uncharacterized protein n=1 Tax=Lentithecium fluviatile CBS 122367 TaxID=1168545 RepID=A0A6G1IL17_9PLEO|nr:hypothetical protein K458DRAFT_135068 [Lentithecium fluviatile CBS 122367]
MHLLSLLVVGPELALAYSGTTTFDTILVAHPEPTICPEPTVGLDYAPDADYVVCCYNGLISATKTTATGPGGKTIYACCEDGYTCTGAASVMSDWSVDSNGDVQLLTLASAPTPTSVPAATTADTANTATVTSLNLGTVSSPGATPYTTSAGVVIYNNINNSDQNTNNNGDGSGNQDSTVSKNEGKLSGGAIAGITVACTIVMTIVGVLGLWS